MLLTGCLAAKLKDSGTTPMEAKLGTVRSGRNQFYVERTNEGSVNLLRYSNVLELYGEFCCRVADAADVNHTLCIDLGEFIYRIQCSTVGN